MLKRIIILSMLIGLFNQCKDKYVSPYTSPNVGYLVVEGLISGNVPVQYVLSRTLPLPGDTTIPKETGANVQVEGSDGSVVLLVGRGGGIYSSADTPMLSVLNQYRLRIHTSEGEDYLSDFVPFRASPPIDSINWIDQSAGVTIYANTHDPANATRYYQWNFAETWEYHAAEETDLEYDTATGQVITRPAASQIYSCWHTDTATSILVSQWALTDLAYNYMSILQKNTESLGSIFDVQPSLLVGNIHCLTKPSEQVIGWVSAGTLQQQRIFIYETQLANWRYDFSCGATDSVIPLDSAKERMAYGTDGFTPIRAHLPPGAATADGYYANSVGCVDCRAQGGITVRPPYWPANY